MIERELARRELSSAVLAAILVAQIDVAARELHFLTRQTIERQELDDMRNENLSRRRADVVVLRLYRDVRPVLEVVSPILRVDCANLPFVQKRQRTAHRSDLHGLEDAIQDEDMSVEHNPSPKHTRGRTCFHARTLQETGGP